MEKNIGKTEATKLLFVIITYGDAEIFALSIA
jgi:hypothetical protein